MGTSAWATDPYTLTDNGDGTWTETYDFDAARSSSGNTYFTRVEAFNLGGTERTYYSFDCDRIELNERFSADELGDGGTKVWEIGKTTPLHHTFGTNHGFQVLKLKAGDKVAFFYFAGYAGTASFRGTPNVEESVNAGDALVSGTEYTIKENGPLTVTVPNNSTTQISKIAITTSAPVLARPSFSFSEMTKSGDYYNPTFVPTSTDAGVTFKKKDDDTDVTSGYTFTSAGALTVYASKAGRPNSARASYTVTAAQVGMILANSVATSSLISSAINYETGAVPTHGSSVSGTWIIPGLTFGSGFVFRTSPDRIKQESGSNNLTCTVLNENRVAVFKHNYYIHNDSTRYDYLTSDKNYANFNKTGTGGSMKSDVFLQYDLYVSPSEVVSTTIGATGYSTFSCPVPLDFSGISGLTAYVAKSVGDGKVTLTSVTTAPANTGLVLKGTAGVKYDIPVTASAEAPASNLLVGCIVSTTVAADATFDFNNYVLVNEGGTAKFQSLVENGATVTGGKAFLKNGAYSSGARSLQIVFDDETTGISRIENGELKVENSVYDLQGRRVTKPTKGLYIVNGKKVIMK